METEPSDPRIEVIHLVFRDFGPDPFCRFIQSYRAHPAGLVHELLIALKGFDCEEEAAAPWLAALADLPHRLQFVPNHGFDIGSYLHLARQSEAKTLCLLNSKSVILGDEWLRKLYTALEEQGGGMVGATGSWESIAADHRLAPFTEDGGGWKGPARRARHWLRVHRNYIRALRRYPAFPNPALRTNAFLIARDLLLSLAVLETRSKDEAMQIESGRQSLTRQVRRRGDKVRVVDGDGQAWEPRDWHRSGTFRHGEQEMLLIGDNQTEAYARGNADLRAWLHRIAWRG